MVREGGKLTQGDDNEKEIRDSAEKGISAVARIIGRKTTKDDGVLLGIGTSSVKIYEREY